MFKVLFQNFQLKSFYYNCNCLYDNRAIYYPKIFIILDLKRNNNKSISILPNVIITDINVIELLSKYFKSYRQIISLVPWMCKCYIRIYEPHVVHNL